MLVLYSSNGSTANAILERFERSKVDKNLESLFSTDSEQDGSE